MKLKIMLLTFTSFSLFAMENPGKRLADETIEQLQGESKTQRRQEEAVYPLASLPGLPDELKVAITQYLLDTPGNDDGIRLLNAAQNIRSLFISNKEYKRLLDDVDLAGQIIKELAVRYTANDLVAAAITFNTNAASKWLAQHIRNRKFNPDGSLKETDKLSEADLKLTDDVQRAFDYAADNERVDILRFLIEHQPIFANMLVNTFVNDQPTKLPLLEIAFGKQNAPMLRLLLRSGARITSSIITAAAAQESPFALEHLKAAGVDLNARYDGDFLIHYAYTEPVIAYLVAQGADINAKNSKNRTALEEALLAEQFDIANRLLQHGADPNIQNERGWTALHLALYKNADVATLKNILSKFTNLEIAEQDGNTPLALAIIMYNPDAIELLLTRGARLPERVHIVQPNGTVGALSPLAYLLLRPLDNAQVPVFLRVLDLVLASGADPNEIIIDPNLGETSSLLGYVQKKPLNAINRLVSTLLRNYGAHE